MNIRTKSVSAGIFGLTMLLTSISYGASMGAVNEPIRLAVNEWTGQHITTHVAGQVLERAGYKVEYVTAGYYPQMTAIRDNTVTATLEIWSSNIGEHYAEAIASGQVEELGDLGLVPVETWMYNDAAGEACPGLPDWNALNGCTDKFAKGDTFPKGRLVDYPADWGTSNVDRIKGLNLDYVSVPAGSEGAIIAEIKGADARKEPLLVMFWAPHWVQAVVNLTNVSLPPYEPGCHDDPAVGVNPTGTWDCDWERGYIKKMAWVGMKDQWPAAHAILAAYTLRNQDQIPMMNAIDQAGGDLEDVVREWVDNNEAIWKPWVDAATN